MCKLKNQLTNTHLRHISFPSNSSYMLMLEFFFKKNVSDYGITMLKSFKVLPWIQKKYQLLIIIYKISPWCISSIYSFKHLFPFNPINRLKRLDHWPYTRPWQILVANLHFPLSFVFVKLFRSQTKHDYSIKSSWLH